MQFEWDPAKAAKNLDQRGFDFAAATEIFEDLHRVERPDDRRNYGEVRIKVTGRARNGTVLVVIYSVRNGITRIISARRASKSERRIYDQSQSTS